MKLHQISILKGKLSDNEVLHPHATYQGWLNYKKINKTMIWVLSFLRPQLSVYMCVYIHKLIIYLHKYFNEKTENSRNFKKNWLKILSLINLI